LGRKRERKAECFMGLVDKPLQFLIAVLVVATAIRAMPRRRWRRSHRSPLWVRIAWITGLVLVMLVALLTALDATPYASVNICLDLWEGYEWCNRESEP
jgi:cytochrome c oxidase assembly factor CtaG